MPLQVLAYSADNQADKVSRETTQAVAIIHVLVYSPRNPDQPQHLCIAAIVSLNLLNDSLRMIIVFYVILTMDP